MAASEGVQGRAAGLADRDLLVFNEVALRDLLHTPDGPVGKDIVRRATRVQSAAKRLLSQPGRGRVYGKHQASAPGDPPAVDTGLLRASVDQALGRDADGELFAIVGTNQKRGFYLEVGTRHVAPRPWLRIAMRAAGDLST